MKPLNKLKRVAKQTRHCNIVPLTPADIADIRARVEVALPDATRADMSLWVFTEPPTRMGRVRTRTHAAPWPGDVRRLLDAYEELQAAAIEAGMMLAVLSLQIQQKPYRELTEDFQAQIVAAEKGLREALSAEDSA